MLCLDHSRQRATGPCFPLTVLHCRTHELGFTLYPPGHVPYGRAAVAPAASAVDDAAAGAEVFADTLLDAACDAAQGTAWPRDRPGGSAQWWSSQGRQLDAAVRLCGVAPDLDPAARQAQAAALWLDALLLLEGAHAISAAAGYRSRGQATVAVLERLASGPCLLQRVLAAGHLAGLWGPPWRWDPTTQQLQPWAFRGDGTRPP